MTPSRIDSRLPACSPVPQLTTQLREAMMNIKY